MTKLAISAFDLAQRYLGIHEIPGSASHPLIQWWLSLCSLRLDAEDEIAWCSAFVNGICWELRLPRSKSAAARSWLTIGSSVEIDKAEPGFDVAILMRGTGRQPGPEITNAPGHVGFFAGYDGITIRLLGGNQSDSVSLVSFPADRILGIRRLQ